MALVMRVIPVEMYDQCMTLMKARSEDPPEPTVADPPPHTDSMDVDAAPPINLPDDSKNLPPDEPKDPPNKSIQSNFPEWKEFSDKSTYTEPEAIKTPPRNRRSNLNGNKRRRKR